MNHFKACQDVPEYSTYPEYKNMVVYKILDAICGKKMYMEYTLHPNPRPNRQIMIKKIRVIKPDGTERPMTNAEERYFCEDEHYFSNIHQKAVQAAGSEVINPTGTLF